MHSTSNFLIYLTVFFLLSESVSQALTILSILYPFAERLYAAPAEIVALLSIFYGGISIVAVIGNTLVIWVVATTRQMRTVTNMYIANLAFADVIIGLFCIPFQVSGGGWSWCLMVL